MLKAYFISDVHLGSLEDQRAQLFLGFLKGLKAENCSHLFLMGDIFDMWIGAHRYYIEKYEPVIAEVKRLQSAGIEVHYFEGNHDLYLERFWGKTLGVKIHPGPEYFDLGPFTVRVEHGDQMDLTDRGYLFLRWFLRTPFMRFLSLVLPGPVVRWLGDTSSRHSRTYTTELKTISDEKAVKNIRGHAEKVMALRPYDYIFSGHVHVRDEYEFQAKKSGASGEVTARSINLGTWMNLPCYYTLEEHGGELIILK